MGLTLVTPPAAEPLTLAEVKAHLRIDTGDEDTLLTGLIEAARLHLEGKDGWLNRAFITQTWDWTRDCFPVWWHEQKHFGVWPGPYPVGLAVPLAPLQSVTHIKYIDPDGVEQTLDPAKYMVDTKSAPARIFPAYEEVWPPIRFVPNAVTVRFVAGYGAAAADVPRPIRTAMLGLIADFYENRSAEGPVPQWIKNLLAPFKVWL